jgi:hypothetical protein
LAPAATQIQEHALLLLNEQLQARSLARQLQHLGANPLFDMRALVAFALYSVLQLGAQRDLHLNSEKSVS